MDSDSVTPLVASVVLAAAVGVTVLASSDWAREAYDAVVGAFTNRTQDVPPSFARGPQPVPRPPVRPDVVNNMDDAAVRRHLLRRMSDRHNRYATAFSNGGSVPSGRHPAEDLEALEQRQLQAAIDASFAEHERERQQRSHTHRGPIPHAAASTERAEDTVTTVADAADSEGFSVTEESVARGGRGICCVCYSHHSDVVLVPCGHVCVCSGCGEKLENRKCPLCKTNMEMMVKVYVS